MIVYHGSSMVVKCPDLKHAKRFLDFGPGFYVTTYQSQAEKWALRKAMRLQGDAVLNKYEITLDEASYRILKFNSDDEKWLDFVTNCRNGNRDYMGDDAVVGNVADDDVFKTIDFYLRGIWDKRRALQELRYYRLNDQICLLNQKLIDLHLKFIEAYEVSNVR